MTLPLSSLTRVETAEAGRASHSGVAVQPVVNAMNKPSCILVVEDNEDNRIIYGTMLRAHGFEVREAAGGEAGIAMARAARPELVLMDIGLPSMDGVEATRLLKQDPLTADIPVLALTAHALLTERQRAVQAGVDGYLTKPISRDALIRAVERALSTARAAHPDPGAMDA